jgi:hypothetical protein
MPNNLYAFCLFCAFLGIGISSESAIGAERPVLPVNWGCDYHEALDEAAASGSMAILWFYDAADVQANERFQAATLGHEHVAAAVSREFIAAALPIDAQVESKGNKQVGLLAHPAFAEMRRRPGIAIIDMRDEGSPHFRQVVSIFPFEGRAINADELLVLLELPTGTLTQRSLIFAVRTHPEHPASALTGYSQLLAKETEKHADHQASIALQGHHNWERRFHEINAQLPGGLLAQEVCAESWPGQNLMAAATECVHSWRQSPGHWSAVSGEQSLFAYDMKRGRNGVWYGVGIFARRH